jgi:hypothetical protein
VFEVRYFHRDGNLNCRLLGYDAMYSYKWSFLNTGPFSKVQTLLLLVWSRNILFLLVLSGCHRTRLWILSWAI